MQMLVGGGGTTELQENKKTSPYPNTATHPTSTASKTRTTSAMGQKRPKMRDFGFSEAEEWSDGCVVVACIRAAPSLFVREYAACICRADDGRGSFGQKKSFQSLRTVAMRPAAVDLPKLGPKFGPKIKNRNRSVYGNF